MNILILGHTGLIGSNLLEKLVNDGHVVQGISKSQGFDLNNKDRVQREMELFKPEVVYMLAANAAESSGQYSPIDMTKNNIDIFVNVLKAAINVGVRKFVYTSSVAVYGEATFPYKEDGLTAPKDIYGVNKLACEQILKIMAKVYNFKYTIFRPHNVYGPGMKMDDPSRNVVALFMRKLKKGEPYVLYGKGQMQRQFSYVKDIVEVLALATERLDDITMNVGTDKPTNVARLSLFLQEMTGIRVPVEMQEARPQEISMFLADHTLQNKLLSYEDTPLEVGLAETWKWLQNQQLKKMKKRGKEIDL